MLRVSKSMLQGRKPIQLASIFQRSLANQSFKTKSRAMPSVDEMKNAGALCEFASTGDVSAMEKLVKSGADINSCDYDFRTPLHIASAAGNKEAVEWLLENGAKNIFDRFGGLPVHDAQRGSHTAITNLLKKSSSNVDNMFVDGMGMDKTMQKVFDLIVNEGVFSFSLILGEIDSYYHRLGLDPIYFELFTAPQIAKHIHSFIAAKKVAFISQTPENIRVDMVDKDSMVAIFTDQNHKNVEKAVSKFMANSPDCYHTSFMRSKTPAVEGMEQHLCIYHVKRTKFENPVPAESYYDDLQMTTSADYLKTKPEYVIEDNSKLMRDAMDKPYPVLQWNSVPNSNLKNLRIAHRTERKNNKGEHEIFMRQLNEIFSRYGIADSVTKKYVDSFSNGLTIYSTFFECPDEKMKKLMAYASLAFLLPETSLSPTFMAGDLSGHEYLYFHAVARFAYYFHANQNENFDELYKYFKNDKVNRDKLLTLGQSLGTETHTLPILYAVMLRNLSICKAMFRDMSKKVKGPWEGYEYPDMNKLISKVRDPEDREILRTMQLFNESITCTNLWADKKSAVSYRMDPSKFLGQHRVPEIPHAVYMVLGYDFTGFHVRFRDISRGGVRVILSGEENYVKNRQTQFQENFNLAYTQKLKNKDIPESGSKGTILMKQGKNDKQKLAFKQYVDSVIDICLKSPGVASIENKPEVIFLGPDENTADCMDSACTYAQERDYGYWRAFTTGKSTSLGGIPHDTYGMTTRSVRQFVEGVQRKLNLNEEECTKLMTGGPDGDLGSNEVLMSKEKIVGVVDGSGVLYDPNGINREFLNKLAIDRNMIDKYEGPLSDGGFKMLIGESNITLPNGEVIDSGLDFRNGFHLWEGAKADFFVPCGGRPQSVNIDNVHKLFEKDGVTPRFKYIVEGANLFVTDAARIYLQDRGVPLFKDASTNKGGVTSSSLEVLAGLAMNSEDFEKHMCVRSDGSIPEFYEKYAAEICEIVEANATKEFEYIWEQTYANEGNTVRATEITDSLSAAMNDLNDTVAASDLFERKDVRRTILSKKIPKCLQDEIGLDSIMERVPDNYQRAIFSMGIATEFIYKYGDVDSPYYFYKFMDELGREASGETIHVIAESVAKN